MCAWLYHVLQTNPRAHRTHPNNVLADQASGAKLLFTGAPSFQEFVVNLPSPAEEINAALLEHNIIGGLPLAKWYPELGPNASLWCATEVTTRHQIDTAAEAVKRTRSVYEDYGLLTV